MSDSEPTKEACERDARLIAAIAEAERGNRGEVRIHLEKTCPEDDTLVRAEQVFGKLGMHETKDDTGVLLYIAREDHKVAVYAGKGIHGAAETGFWQDVCSTVAAGFKAGEGVGGMEKAMAKVGELLREHAPGDDAAGDELPNAVTTS